NRRLRHSALTQQYHLDALALRRGNLPPQRSPQPPHLGFAAFGHLFPRIRWRSESHLGQQKQPAVPAAYLKNPPIQAVMEVVLGYFSETGETFAILRDGPVPTIVFHGDRDTIVHPRNADHVI